MKYHIDSVVMAEQSLLGALMQEPEKLVEVKQLLMLKTSMMNEIKIFTVLFYV